MISLTPHNIKVTNNSPFRNKTFFIIIFLVLILAPIVPVLALTACPFGQINDPYPGQCARYIDTNNDNLCDLSQTEQQNPGRDYNFLPITAVLLVLYLSGLALVEAQKISRVIHRKIWNCILGVTFLGSAGLGLFLVIQLNYQIFKTISPKFLFWHVEFSVAFAVVAVFHLLWHLLYFKNLFKKYKPNVSSKPLSTKADLKPPVKRFDIGR